MFEYCQNIASLKSLFTVVVGKGNNHHGKGKEKALSFGDWANIPTSSEHIVDDLYIENLYTLLVLFSW